MLVLFVIAIGDHVGDRAFAVRQGAAGDPRQRDPRRLRRHLGAALPLDRLRHLGLLHGLAGVLWVPLNGLTTPDILYWPFSGEIVFMTVLGGFRNFTGPIVGAVVFNYLKIYAVASTEYWQLLLGVRARGPGDGAADRHRRHASRAWPPSSEEDADMSLLQTVDLKKLFRRDARRRQRQPHHRGGRVRLAGRPQRRRQDLAHQSHQRAICRPDSGKIIFEGEDITHAVGDRARQGRHRPQLPARQPVRRTYRLRQRRAGDLLARGQDRATWRRSRTSTSDVDATRPTRCSASSVSPASATCWRADLAQGERKLLDVALAYALQPKLLFLDEPTSGVSTRDKGQIMDTIASVVRGEGITAVVIEHDMDVVFKYSDRIVVMHQGAILAQGTPDEIRTNEQVAMVLLGSSGPDAFARKD